MKQSSQKMGRDTLTFHRRGATVAKRHTQKSSALTASRDTQIKAPMRCYYTPIGLATVKSSDNSACRWECGWYGPPGENLAVPFQSKKVTYKMTQ